MITSFCRVFGMGWTLKAEDAYELRDLQTIRMC